MSLRAVPASRLKGGGYLKLATIIAGVVGGWRDPGDAASVTISKEVETSDEKENRSGKFQTIQTDVTATTYSVVVEFKSITIENYAIYLGADVEKRTIAATPVTAEALYRAERGSSYFPGASASYPEGIRKIASVEEVRIKGDARVNSTEVVAGKVVIISSAAYVYTVGGTTAASPPSLPTNGGTVADGTGAILKHLGPVAAVATDDYVISLNPAEVQLKDDGDLYIAMGRMPTGYLLDLEIDYTPVASTQVRLKPQASEVMKSLRFSGRSTKGNPFDFIAPYTTAIGSGESEWINPDTSQSLSITFTPLALDPNNEPIIINAAEADWFLD